MKYIDMMKKAKADGVTSDKAMWKSVESVDEILCIVRVPAIFYRIILLEGEKLRKRDAFSGESALGASS